MNFSHVHHRDRNPFPTWERIFPLPQQIVRQVRLMRHRSEIENVSSWWRPRIERRGLTLKVTATVPPSQNKGPLQTAERDGVMGRYVKDMGLFRQGVGRT